jgi:hypothetical protein
MTGVGDIGDFGDVVSLFYIYTIAASGVGRGVGDGRDVSVDVKAHGSTYHCIKCIKLPITR